MTTFYLSKNKNSNNSNNSGNCCTTFHINCCTPQYQRLNLFTSYITDGILLRDTVGVAEGIVSVSRDDTINVMGTGSTPVYNRCGQQIPLPVGCSDVGFPSFEFTPNTPPGIIDGAYCQSNSGCTGDSPYAPESFLDKYVAYSAYYFVNEFAYSPYEPRCHSDQVYGWFVNIKTGELQLFAQYKNVPTNATRNCLFNTFELTKLEKSQLKTLNILYKLSKASIKTIRGIPSPEGNIIKVYDCKGNEWLIYINTASIINGSPLATCNYEFAIVGCKLC